MISVGQPVPGNSATKRTALATSSGWIIRSPARPRSATIAVFTKPGQMADTLTPALRRSSKSEAVYPTTPCLLAQ